MNLMPIISKYEGIKNFNNNFRIIAEDKSTAYECILVGIRDGWRNDPEYVFRKKDGKQIRVFRNENIIEISRSTRTRLFEKIMGLSPEDKVLLASSEIVVTHINLINIQKEVENYFCLPDGTISIKTRKREIVQARQIAHYFSKRFTTASLAFIGSTIGGKDHATVMHSCKIVNDLIETDKKFRQYVVDLEKIFRNTYLIKDE